MLKLAAVAGLFGTTWVLVIGFLKYTFPLPGTETAWLVNQMYLIVPLAGLLGMAAVSFKPATGALLMLASAAGVFALVAIGALDSICLPAGVLLLAGCILGLMGTAEKPLQTKLT